MAKEVDVKRTLTAVGRLLGQVAKRHPDVQDITAKIVDMLSGLGPDRGGGDKLIQRRGGEGVRYTVETTNKRELLFEHRPAGSPLRLSHDLFVHVVGVLALSAKALPYDEFAKRVEEATGAEMADWQGRLALRYLMRADPPLLLRERSRYRAKDPSHLPAAAERYWRSTARL